MRQIQELMNIITIPPNSAKAMSQDTGSFHLDPNTVQLDHHGLLGESVRLRPAVMAGSLDVPLGVLTFDHAGVWPGLACAAGVGGRARRWRGATTGWGCQPREGGKAPCWAIDLREIRSAATKETRSGSWPACSAASNISVRMA